MRFLRIQRIRNQKIVNFLKTCYFKEENSLWILNMSKENSEIQDETYRPQPHPERVSQEVIDAFNATFDKKFGWYLSDLEGNRLKEIM